MLIPSFIVVCANMACGNIVIRWNIANWGAGAARIGFD
jgi:hypothetical protein